MINMSRLRQDPQRQIRTINDITDPRVRRFLAKAICDHVGRMAQSSMIQTMKERTKVTCEKDLMALTNKLELSEARGKEAFGRRIRRVEKVLGAKLPPLIDLLSEPLTYGNYTAHGINAIMDMWSMSKGTGVYYLTKRIMGKIVETKKEFGASLTGRILDFGCNVGWMTEMMATEFHSEVWGIDNSPREIALGRFLGVKNLVDANCVGIECIGRMPFDDGHFKAVISRATLFDAPGLNPVIEDNCEDKVWRHLAEIYRVLSPHGFVLMNTITSRDDLLPFMNPFFDFDWQLKGILPHWTLWRKK